MDYEDYVNALAVADLTVEEKPVRSSGQPAGNNQLPISRGLGLLSSSSTYGKLEDTQIATVDKECAHLAEKWSDECHSSDKGKGDTITISTSLTSATPARALSSRIPSYRLLSISPLGKPPVFSNQPGHDFIPYRTTRHRTGTTAQAPGSQSNNAAEAARDRGSVSPSHSSGYSTRQSVLKGLTSTLSEDEITPLPVPTPTVEYLASASSRLSRLSTPQTLLIVLDLNGTLLSRTHGKSTYTPRPGLDRFLKYCIDNHKVLIWSSASPRNVSAICGRIFTIEQRMNLLGEWARDKFDLTAIQYAQKLQVYKRLDRTWANDAIQRAHPFYAREMRWGQENTVLVDDSPLKACKQPHNLIEIPMFTKSQVKLEAGGDVLSQLAAYLEEARSWENVSSFIKVTKFQVNNGVEW